MKAQESVLIIDDDEDMCHLLKRLLANRKIHAATAHNLQNGYDCLLQIAPKVVFLDNNLPDGSGIDFIKKIREFDDSIKIVMITGDTVKGLREDALKKGVFSFLPKPFSYELIDKTVASMGMPLPFIFFPFLSVFSFF